jgi:excinuclease UvrABC helicase subunit UvrB
VSMPQIPRVDRDQAITDMIEALAMQEAAVAALIHAEAGKVDALVVAGIPAAAATADVESYQAAVSGVIQATAEKQQGLANKLELLMAMIAEMKQVPNP